MTAFATVAPSAEMSPPATVQARFTGRMESFRNLMIRGAFLQVTTLGIYRFWLNTDVRRFLWSNTEVGGESPEYTGTAMELLLGFLMAIAILVPIFVLIALGGLSMGPLGQLAGLFGYVFLAVFGQYAYFRARRYRLTRTVFRGVRMHQTGSAWRYAVRSVLWGLVVGLTFGLAYPFAQASLERYKLSCTFYGDLQGSFIGRGSSLFLHGSLMWLIVVAPLVASAMAAIALIDWQSIADAVRLGAREDLPRVLESTKGFKEAVGFATFGIGWVMFFAVVLYPAFQAMVLRWWLNGLRFGDVYVSAKLRTGQVYGCYLRYLGWSLVFSLIVGTVLGLSAFIGGVALTSAKIDTETVGILAVIFTVVAYLAFAFCIWVIYQVTVRLRLWRITVDSVLVAGFDAVERVRADDSRPSSSVGEGLVDALGAGGI